MTPLEFAPGCHLTAAQRTYLETYMVPCRPGQVTAATVRITWNDSQGIPNTAHDGPGGFGPVVPIAVREATLTLWRDLASGPAGLAGAAGRLDAAARSVLAGTTTDQEPLKIFKTGVEATGRALAQHALIADQTPYRTPVEFARGLRDSGIFHAVASHWYWELQASTYRRGMIPARFAPQPNGTVRYSPETLATLRAMKEHTIATAHDVMRRATGEEGLTVPEAVQKYHHELDLISAQYALMSPGEQPRCLASMTHVIGGERFTVLPVVVDRFIETFIRVVDGLRVRDVSAAAADELITDPRDRVFHVPDMSCQHCIATITGVLRANGVELVDIDLVSKRVVADFGTVAARERAFAAIRDSGYTVIPFAAAAVLPGEH